VICVEAGDGSRLDFTLVLPRGDLANNTMDFLLIFERKFLRKGFSVEIGDCLGGEIDMVFETVKFVIDFFFEKNRIND